MSKTADYTQRAINNYQKTKDRIILLANKGTKDRIKAIYSGSINEYITQLVYKQLEIDEKHQNKEK